MKKKLTQKKIKVRNEKIKYSAHKYFIKNIRNQSLNIL